MWTRPAGTLELYPPASGTEARQAEPDGSQRAAVTAVVEAALLAAGAALRSPVVRADRAVHRAVPDLVAQAEEVVSRVPMRTARQQRFATLRCG